LAHDGRLDRACVAHRVARVERYPHGRGRGPAERKPPADVRRRRADVDAAAATAGSTAGVRGSVRGSGGGRVRTSRSRRVDGSEVGRGHSDARASDRGYPMVADGQQQPRDDN
jgi:hypothetical protein